MSIRTEERHCETGTLGVITLDAPSRLNALNGEMVDAMAAALDQWRDNDAIALVVIRAAGDKGFCAGGDLRDIYEALQSSETAGIETARSYFGREYRLDYSLYRFPKPVICIAHGITMGGGLGILSACRYRLVTPDVRLATPEAAIGFFPEAGGSWFLNRLPEGIGLFMGLSGARLNATDALRLGLADRMIPAQATDSLLDQLQSQHWRGEAAADDNRLFRLLNSFEEPATENQPVSQLAALEGAISVACRQSSLPAIVSDLLRFEHHSQWWQDCKHQFKQASPLSLHLIHRQLESTRQKGLADRFAQELYVAEQCVRGKEFREGIRARLIDRDQSPKWQYTDIENVPPERVAAHFPDDDAVLETLRPDR